MPGRPVRRRALAAISSNGGLDGILERISQGESITKVAEGLDISRALLSEILNQPENLPALRAARALAATAFAEETVSIADSAEPATAQVARLRIDARQWLAARWGREVYGERSVSSVQLNLAQIHADTIRRCCAEERAKRAKAIEAQVTTVDGTNLAE
jgi:hypothetical protein